MRFQGGSGKNHYLGWSGCRCLECVRVEAVNVCRCRPTVANVSCGGEEPLIHHRGSLFRPGLGDPRKPTVPLQLVVVVGLLQRWSAQGCAHRNASRGGPCRSSSPRILYVVVFSEPYSCDPDRIQDFVRTEEARVGPRVCIQRDNR